MNNEFKLLNRIQKFIDYINKYVFTSFPKKDLAIKIRLENCLYELLECTIRARINSGNIRNKYLKDCLVDISLIDYYMGTVYKLEIINKKRYIIIVNNLIEISKMINGWINNEKIK